MTIELYTTDNGEKVHSQLYCLLRHTGMGSVNEVGPEAVIERDLCGTCWRDVDVFTTMTKLFNEESGINDIDADRDEMYENRFVIVREEWGEFEKAVENLMYKHQGEKNDTVAMKIRMGEEDVAEEMADLVFTLFSMADRLGIDLAKAYKKKSAYNLTKVGSEIVDGKVQDDSATVKPLFNDCVEDDDDGS